MSLATFLIRAFERAVEPLGEFGFDELLDVALDHPVPPVAAPPGITLKLAGPADVDVIARLYLDDLWLYIGQPGDTLDVARALYLDRFARGELCYMAMAGEAIAHLNWTCAVWGDALPEHPIRLRDGEIYTTDALTTPAFRGRGLHAYVLGTMLAQARARGQQRAYTLARVDRPDTYKALTQVGYRPRGRVMYFLPRGRKRAWFLWQRGDLEPLFRRPTARHP